MVEREKLQITDNIWINIKEHKETPFNSLEDKIQRPLEKCSQLQGRVIGPHQKGRDESLVILLAKIWQAWEETSCM